jgi:exopolysaccharide production protein ExoZ
MQTTNKQTIVSIQLLRAIAALSVVYVHCADGIVCDSFKTTGRFGVDIFFVISGFVIAYVVSRSEGGAGNFLIKRVIRIEPMYLLATIAMVFTAVIFPGMIKNNEVSVSGFIKSVLFIPGPENGGSPVLDQGWTLNYEMLFYVVMFLCVLFVKNKKYLTTACVLILVFIMAILQFGNTDSFILKYYGPSMFLEFIYGIILYHLYTLFEKINSRLPINRWIKMIILISSAILWYGFMIYCDLGNHYLLVSRGIIFGIPAAAVVGSVLFLEKEIDRDNRAVRFGVDVGEASYVMYLIHCLVIVFFAKAVFKEAAGTNCAFIYEIVKIIITVIATITFSMLIHRFIDTPVQRYLKRALIKKNT